MACLMLKVVHVLPGPQPAENREAGNTVANSLALCLLGGRQAQVRALLPFEVANRVRHLSRTRRSARVGCWVTVVCNLLEGSGGRRNFLGRQLSSSGHELVGTWWQRRSQSPRASGRGGGACRRYGGARPGIVGSSRGSERLGSRHFSQGGGPPDQERDVSGHPQSMSRETLDRLLQRSQKAMSEGKGGKNKGARYTVDQAGVQLSFSWNFGSGTSGELSPGSSRRAGRAHKCTTCRSDKHPARQCRLDKAEKKGLGPRPVR